jgi:heme oxygenase
MSTLRELTAENHAKAEQTPFMRLFIAKAITEAEYMKYITQLAMVYTALEHAADKFGILKELPGITRLNNLRSDVFELNTKLGMQSEIVWGTLAYYNFIVNIKDRETLLAHFYVRYSADMYGGQILKSLAHGSGKLYEFGDSLPFLRQKMRELATPALAVEANNAFNYNIRILNEIMDLGIF